MPIFTAGTSDIQLTNTTFDKSLKIMPGSGTILPGEVKLISDKIVKPFTDFETLSTSKILFI